MKSQAQKPEDTTTIEISIANAKRLHSIADSLQTILRKRKVSLDQVINVLLTAKSLDVILQDMILEDSIAH